MVVFHIVIGRVNVRWVQHFASHNYITHRLREAPMDAFLVVTSHVSILMSVLKYDTRGETMMSDPLRNAPGPVTDWGQDEGMHLLRRD